jgi:ABC-type multidrug transport system fused ATPase/permease subunit
MSDDIKPTLSTIRDCISVFSPEDRKKIFGVIILQTFLGVLDLIGVALIGVIGALAVTGIQSATPGNRVSDVLELLGLDGYTLQTQTAILAIVAACVLIGRTLFSVFFTRKILFFIGRRSALISGNLIRRLLMQDNLQVNSRTIQETIYATTTGVVSVTLGVVGTLVVMIADVSLLLVMAAGLLIVDPIVAASTFFLFSLVGLGLYKVMHRRAINLGKKDAELNVFSNEKISEVLTSYREATVRSRRGHYAEEISAARYRLSDVLAELSFMPSISKYVIEGTIIIGAVSVSAIQFLIQDSRNAIATLAIFMAAGTRIAPAVLRVQQGSISIKSSLGSAKPTLRLLSELPELERNEDIPAYIQEYPGLVADIQITDLSFTYPGVNRAALTDVNLSVNSGTTCAIVGPSGSGKTTLADLILGMFQPTTGRVLIGGQEPLDLIRRYPGAIAYVPQDVSIIQGTIRENIALGFPSLEATDSRVNATIQIAGLTEFIRSLPKGIDTEVGPRGSKLSGGQRQRLGIARALFTRPKLIIFDESTSALDAETETKVASSINSIPYETTMVIIAHRLSTIQKADTVAYVDNGRLVAKGTFNEIRRLVPDFDNQAKLMGITQDLS